MSSNNEDGIEKSAVADHSSDTNNSSHRRRASIEDIKNLLETNPPDEKVLEQARNRRASLGRPIGARRNSLGAVNETSVGWDERRSRK